MYCKTLIFGGHFILALLVVKEKNAKIKKLPIKIKKRKTGRNIFQIHIPSTVQGNTMSIIALGK